MFASEGNLTVSYTDFYMVSIFTFVLNLLRLKLLGANVYSAFLNVAEIETRKIVLDFVAFILTPAPLFLVAVFTDHLLTSPFYLESSLTRLVCSLHFLLLLSIFRFLLLYSLFAVVIFFTTTTYLISFSRIPFLPIFVDVLTSPSFSSSSSLLSSYVVEELKGLSHKHDMLLVWQCHHL